MYKNIKVLLSIVIFSSIIMLSACGIQDTASESTRIKDRESANADNKINETSKAAANSCGKSVPKVSPSYGSTYKIFYGEWEISKVIGYDNHFGESFPDANKMIGKRIRYDKEAILANEQLGLKGEYYVFVHVETLIPGVNLGIDFGGDEFFIVDDRKIILVKNNVFYLAERVSHIRNQKDMDYSHI